MTLSCVIRPGSHVDTGIIAELMLRADGGLFGLMFDGAVPGLTVADLLALAINQEASPWHYENVLLAQVDDQVCSLALAFASDEFGLHDDLRAIIPQDRLKPLLPFLESVVPPSLYVNSLAVLPAWERLGIAGRLMAATAMLAKARGFADLSLHVWADNAPALGFYKKLGFVQQAAIPIPASPYLRFAGPLLLLTAPVTALEMP